MPQLSSITSHTPDITYDVIFRVRRENIYAKWLKFEIEKVTLGFMLCNKI